MLYNKSNYKFKKANEKKKKMAPVNPLDFCLLVV